MHIITISHPNKGNVVKFKLSLKKTSILLILVVTIFMAFASWGTYRLLKWHGNKQKPVTVSHLLEDEDAMQIENLKQQTEDQLAIISDHIGRLSANLLRLNTLGEQLIAKAELDPEEFNFGESPGMGGPLIEDTLPVHAMLKRLTDLEALINKRYQQLSFLEDFFHDHRHRKSLDLWGSGKPVKRGWVSSFFGRRIDPFTGKKSWHNGVDIAGREGDEVLAVASGIVSVAEDRGTYGKLIEIRHANGLSTRYAHNKETLVKPGDLVKKGDAIALLGNTGRSTGPHVHLEVRKDNKSVDPGLYFSDLRRKS